MKICVKIFPFLTFSELILLACSTLSYRAVRRLAVSMLTSVDVLLFLHSVSNEFLLDVGSDPVNMFRRLYALKFTAQTVVTRECKELQQLRSVTRV